MFSLVMLYNYKKQDLKIRAIRREKGSRVIEEIHRLPELTRGTYIEHEEHLFLNEIASIISSNVLFYKEKNEIKMKFNRPQTLLLIKNMSLKSNSKNQSSKEESVQKRKMRLELINRLYKTQPLMKYFIANPDLSYLEPLAVSLDPEIKMQAIIMKRAVLYIQRAYRQHAYQRKLGVLTALRAEEINHESQSLKLLNELVVKDTSNLRASNDNATHGVQASQHKLDLNSRANKDVLYHGPLSFDNTTRTCNIIVTYHQADSVLNTESVLIDITFNVTGKQQALQVPKKDLMPHFNKKEFEKEIKKHLLNNLVFNREENKVVHVTATKSPRRDSNVHKELQKPAFHHSVSDSKAEAKRHQKHEQKNKHENAAILIQKIIRSKQAYKKAQALKLALKRNRILLKKSIKKIDSVYYQFEYLLLLAEKVIEVLVKVVDNQKIRAKARYSVEALVDSKEINELMKDANSVDEVKLRREFSEPLKKLEALLIIKQQKNSLTITFEEIKKQSTPKKLQVRFSEPEAGEPRSRSKTPESSKLNKNSEITEEKSSLSKPSKASNVKQSLKATKDVQVFKNMNSETAAIVIQKHFKGSAKREEFKLMKEAVSVHKEAFAAYKRVAAFVSKHSGKYWIIYVSIDQNTTRETVVLCN